MDMRRITLMTGVTLIAGAALAHSGVKNPVVVERMDAMQKMSIQVKTLGLMAKGAEDFDAEEVQTALDRLASLAEQTPDLFEEPAEDPKSEAQPEIWEDFDTFTMKASALEVLTAGLMVEDRSDLGPALRQIGGACKDCHGRFRD